MFKARLLIASLISGLGLLTTSIAGASSPPTPKDGPVILDTSVIVLDVDGVDDAAQTFDASVFFEISWSDPRVTEEVFNTGRLWKPAVLFGNQQKAWPVLPEAVELIENGQLRVRRSIWGTFSQPLDLRRFPFDKQSLSVLLLADSDPEMVTFSPQVTRPSGVAQSLSVPDWQVLETRASGTLFTISKEIEPVPSFTLSVDVGREYKYYVYAMILPLIVIVCMSFVAPWIEPSNFPAQITVSTTSMLTVVTYRSATVQVLLISPT